MKIFSLRHGSKADARDVSPVVGEVFGYNERSSSGDIVCHAIGMII